MPIILDNLKSALEFADLIERTQTRGIITADERNACDNAIKGKVKKLINTITGEIQ